MVTVMNVVIVTILARVWLHDVELAVDALTAGWHIMAKPVDIKLLGEYSFIIHVVAAEKSNSYSMLVHA